MYALFSGYIYKKSKRLWYTQTVINAMVKLNICKAFLSIEEHKDNVYLLRNMFRRRY